MEKIALYIHIPFCVSKCAYCNFCSFVPTKQQFKEYLAALEKEIELVSTRMQKEVFSIYIGGGTPSILPKGSLINIVDLVKSKFELSHDITITIEANPNSFSLEKAKEYADLGCNRLSLGLQSADEGVLKALGRAHTYRDCQNAVENAISVGINDINVDLMLGVPNQNMKVLRDTLDKVVSLPITHISAYGLILEEGTPLLAKVKNNETILPSEDETADMYDFTVEFLRKNGFFRYEISNFAKIGFESVHNLNYWARGEYVGLGLNAYSFVEGVHYKNTSDFDLYCASYSSGQTCVEDVEKETNITSQNETIMLALRTTKGLNISEFNKKFKVDFEKKYANPIQKLLSEDLIEIKDGFLRIKNFYISNSIIAEFFD